MKIPFHGRGWSFPPTFNPALNGVVMTEDEADIASSLEILLSTSQGERVMRPTYGCNLEELTFENLDTRMKTLMADKIESAILYNEPRIRLEEVALDESTENQGIIMIKVTYRVKTTNSRFNMVYPYYNQEGDELPAAITVTQLPDIH
ncbi:GPW/gp25 family protein [Chlorobium limicola]|uniref:IraD/Gp25-like domain-containing protein n=1 Tax=Chlorobium limicola TaxID=1092 RepID=A0A124G913_CHLLI|nr:GPW/gp25 family protein [Chlorobium limicola]KUL27656.1 hypothetical protein ASB62_06065 [Chlorobium limicola]